ncbi:MAG: hypothetical protein PHX21_12900 [bacterium]|nr:hypothetical protein [bacterium]
MKNSIFFDKYTKQDRKRDMKKSLENYKKMHNTKADMVRIGTIMLPTVVLPNGKKIDLNQWVKKQGGKVIMVGAGTINGIQYVQKKDGKLKTLFHAIKIPIDIVKPSESSTTYYLVEQGQGIRIDETGLWEKKTKL